MDDRRDGEHLHGKLQRIRSGLGHLHLNRPLDRYPLGADGGRLLDQSLPAADSSSYELTGYMIDSRWSTATGSHSEHEVDSSSHSDFEHSTDTSTADNSDGSSSSATATDAYSSYEHGGSTIDFDLEHVQRQQHRTRREHLLVLGVRPLDRHEPGADRGRFDDPALPDRQQQFLPTDERDGEFEREFVVRLAHRKRCRFLLVLGVRPLDRLQDRVPVGRVDDHGHVDRRQQFLRTEQFNDHLAVELVHRHAQRVGCGILVVVGVPLLHRHQRV